MRLVWVEVRRLLARRLFRVAVLLALVALAVTLGRAAYESHAPSAAQVAAAQKQLELVRQQTPPIAQQIAECEKQKGAGKGLPPAFDCKTNIHQPQVSDFLTDRTFRFAVQAPNGLTGFAVVLALLGFVVGASFVGAEWAAGTLGSLLTWEPRRLRVLTAKALALALGLAAVGVAVMATYFAGSYGVAAWRGATTGTTHGLLLSMGLTALRGTGLGIGAGLGGFAVAGALRSTASALGLGFAYFVGAELLLRNFWTGSPRWLLTSNVSAWLLHNFTIDITKCPPQGGQCTSSLIRLSQAHGAVYLGVLIIVALLIWALTLRRRDVT